MIAGRTVPTYRMAIEEIIGELSPYRRALSRRDREAFDALVLQARLHASASGSLARTNPFEAMLLSILVEQEKRIRSLEK